MAKSFNDLLQEIVNKDYSDICNLAKISLADCIDSLKPIVGEDHAITFLLGFIGAAVAADGQYSALEKQLMTDLFGDYERMGKVAALTGAERYETIDSVVDRLPGEVKSKVCFLAVCILAVDEHIDQNEYAYLKKLLE